MCSNKRAREMNRFKIIFGFILLSSIVANAQSRRTAKDMKIKSISIEQKDIKKDSLEISKRTNNVFDKNGNIISEVELNSDSTFKNYDTYVYNKHNDIVEHNEFDKNGKLLRKTISTYDNLNDKTEETTYDSTNTVIEKVKIHYNNFGQKDEEQLLSAEGKMKKKTTYKYDSKGSLVERTYYNSKGEIISIRKSVYQYYN